MKPNCSPIACRLDVFSQEERAREAELLREHRSAIRHIEERADGYSMRYSSDPGLFQRIAELICLEHRCCPFLDFQLEWKGADGAPWLHITGGARVKQFLADTFAPAN